MALAELSDPVETPNNNSYAFHPGSLEEAQAYFRSFAVELGMAFTSLGKRRLVRPGVDLPEVTARGLELARELRRRRPPIWYWYRDFHRAVEHSAAFAEYAQRVFGQNLGQHGFSDWTEIELMMEMVGIGQAWEVLDIGCGTGKIAERISDVTGARVTGIDYVPEAVEQARRRTRTKSGRLQFALGNLDDDELPAGPFALVLAIDSVFFGHDLAITVGRMRERLCPSGKMAVFCSDDLAPALRANSLPFEVKDLSRSHYQHLQLKHRVAAELKDAFEAEGNGFICDNLLTESVASDAPFDAVHSGVRRYLYCAAPQS